MLVDADTGRIDHHDFAFESCGNRCQKPVPHPSFAPADEPVVASRRGAVALGYLGPWRACSEPPENAVQHAPVINAGNAARLVWQKRLDNRPFPVRQFVASPFHPKLLPEALNQPTTLPASQFMSLRPTYFLAEGRLASALIECIVPQTIAIPAFPGAGILKLWKCMAENMWLWNAPAP